jgi:hypothetical protein
MNVTPPEGATEYSTGPGASKPVLGRRLHGDRRRRGARAEQAPGSLRAAILAGAMLGALLLLVAEFTTLFTVHAQTSSNPIKTVETGPHHSYALVLIAVVVAALAIAVWLDSSRPALLAIGLLGIVALLIALLHDLPDAHASGIAGSNATRYVAEGATPSAGLYLETLGAIVLMITCGVGFIALGSPGRRPKPQGPQAQ